MSWLSLLSILNLFFAGTLAGVEVASHYGFVTHPTFPWRGRSNQTPSGSHPSSAHPRTGNVWTGFFHHRRHHHGIGNRPQGGLPRRRTRG